MEKKTLTVTERPERGKAAARRMRRVGMIPAVMYGRTEPRSINVDAHEFMAKFRTVSESTIIKLELAAGSHDVLIRDFQEDCISGKITHIDFLEIELGKALRTNVGVQLSGAPVGVREGGLLESFVHEVEVECMPKDLPEHLAVDITDLQIGHSVHIRDIQIPEGLRILNPADQVVCTIVHKRAEEKPEEAAEELTAEEAQAAADEQAQEA